MENFDFKETENKKVISPIEFVGENYKEKALINFETEVNGDTNFAITRTTANGRFVRGNLLFYKLNGVEVYTDINNIIFVDSINNTLFIRENKTLVEEIDNRSPEEKQYIILYTDLDYESLDEGTPMRWEATQGRKMTYEAIKANASVIDIDKSIVLVDTVSVKDSLSVRDFVNYIKNADYIEDDGFDINSFDGSEYI